jgi:hypothetical protein
MKVLMIIFITNIIMLGFLSGAMVDRLYITGSLFGECQEVKEQ